MVKPYEVSTYLIKKKVVHHYWCASRECHWMLMDEQKGFKNLWYGYVIIPHLNPTGEYGTIDKEQLDEMVSKTKNKWNSIVKCSKPYTLGNFKAVCDSCNIHVEN